MVHFWVEIFLGVPSPHNPLGVNWGGGQFLKGFCFSHTLLSFPGTGWASFCPCQCLFVKGVQEVLSLSLCSRARLMMLAPGCVRRVGGALILFPEPPACQGPADAEL